MTHPSKRRPIDFITKFFVGLNKSVPWTLRHRYVFKELIKLSMRFHAAGIAANPENIGEMRKAMKEDIYDVMRHEEHKILEWLSVVDATIRTEKRFIDVDKTK